MKSYLHLLFRKKFFVTLNIFSLIWLTDIFELLAYLGLLSQHMHPYHVNV